MSYRVIVGHEAKKTIGKLDRTTAGRIRDQLIKLAESSLDARISNQLKMAPERRYARVGDWRIIYEVNENQSIVEVSAIQHRSRVYKGIKK
jgi:mRNA-degrading endonuclease RelE of RelBE toxin-antitoxin system